MNYKQKQQTLVKLAQVRLAINHVIRKRAMQKQAQNSNQPKPIPRKKTHMIPPPIVPPKQTKVNPRRTQPQYPDMSAIPDYSDAFFDMIRPSNATENNPGFRNRNKHMEQPPQSTKPWYQFW